MSVKQLLSVVGLVVLALSLGTAAITSAQTGEEDIQDVEHVLQFDVAENGLRFAFDDLNLHPDGMPGYGTAFVTQGYLYPRGTLNGSNGVRADGSPEFPQLVQGEWFCYGWMIGNGAHTVSGKWVISTQIYRFNDGSTLITDGFEIVNLDVPVERAITGGTGAYRGASGEMVQVLRGFTDQMGVNLNVEFQVDAE